MKKSMPEYIAVLSESDFNILEEIFLDKYQKFVELYWLIRNFSDYTKSLTYQHSEKDTLKVVLTVTKIDVDYVMNEITEKIKKKHNILVWNEGKAIHVEITKKESVDS